MNLPFRLILLGFSFAACLACGQEFSPVHLLLEGELNRRQINEIADQLETANSETATPLLLQVGEYLGFKDGFEDALALRDALAKWNGPKAIYWDGEVLGPPAVLVLSADHVYAAAGAVVSLAATMGGEARPLPELLQARIRSGIPDQRWRMPLTRAMLQVDREMEVAGVISKAEGESLVLTGREAAEIAEGLPLLVTRLYPDFASLTREFEAELGSLVTLQDRVDALTEAEPVDQADDANTEAAPDEPGTPVTVKDAAPASKTAYVVPMTGPIYNPQIYVLRRAIRDAISNDVDTLVLQLDTPGGSGAVMLELMEVLQRFKGTTIAYVDNEATSAGAFMAIVCDYIYFHPTGTMGSAALIQGDGSEVPPTMKAKIMSYINAKVRSATENRDDRRYRYEVMRAMSELDYELVIDGERIQPDQSLLNLTAREAVEAYGRPPQPLLADGIADDVDAILADLYGKGTMEVVAFELSGSEQFAKWFDGFAPVLASLGLLLLFIEFKTPSFGVVGGIGIGLLVLVFLSQYFAGMTGYEPLILLGLGVILIAVELFVTPGVGLLLVGGIICLFASLVWGLAEVWPSDGVVPDVTGEAIGEALIDVFFVALITTLGMAAIWKFLPASPWGKRLIEGGTIETPSVASAEEAELIGQLGEVIRPLRPGGEIEVNGDRYPAHVAQGFLEAGEKVVVVERQPFSLLVRVAE